MIITFTEIWLSGIPTTEKRTSTIKPVSGIAEVITLAPRHAGAVKLRVKAGGDPGNTLVTADVRTEGMDFREWVEALVTVE